ncbi:hypothetical protein Vadar_001572 [Vaccinium darrowii]|uniref:Uncharacterized protein n=1 Tax=Vaccinium darrowii TaxID=229202 RepID=A0ACB7XF60_9ERIC|nr:hypothetical protein Vadar_001572 [Vaccinium darrowii]
MCVGLHKNERERLRIKSFYLRLSVSKTRKNPLPDSLTLHYLPRINGNPLDIDGATIRPDSPAFVTLHRVVSASSDKPVFGSRELVRASEGVRFDVYFGEEKLVRGVFGRDGGGEWKVECKCVLEREVVGMEVKAAEVLVEAEGMVVMSEKVAVAVRRKRRSSGDVGWFQGLEEIPEGREEDELEGCCCCEEEREGGSDGGDCGGEEERDGKCGEVAEVEMEGVRLAAEVGVWVVCLGVGYLVRSSLSRIKLL